MTPPPEFSIITPIYRPAPEDLADTIWSVEAQSFSDWELILVDDASCDDGITRVLHEAHARDNRIRVVERSENGHIVAASNDGLAEATGQWIVLLDHDDLLTSDALRTVHEAISAHPHAGYLYSDEDKIDAEGNLSDTFEKPDWSPERLRHQMYLGHLSVLRSDLVRQVGGFHTGFDGSQDHDLALRVTEQAEEVVHIPEVLYHWRIVPGSTAASPGEKDYATYAGVRAVQEHLRRVGRGRDVVRPARVPHTYVTERWMDPRTLVSVVIPTCGSSGLVWGRKRVFVTEAVRSLLSHTDHTNLEIVVVFDLTTPDEVITDLREIAGPALVEVPYDRPFNFSDKCNVGFLAASGDIVAFLNDDMEIISDRFIEALCAPLSEPDVGMTGARLLYSDSSLQHAGIIIQRGEYAHAYRAVPDEEFGYFSALLVDREVSGLTGACVAMRREVFEEAGGFYIDLPGSFNDVDLCFKVGFLGYRLVWLADVRSFHFESVTRNPTVNADELRRIRDRWGFPERDRFMPHEADEHLDMVDRLTAQHLRELRGEAL